MIDLKIEPMHIRQRFPRIFSNTNEPILESLIKFLNVAEKFVFDLLPR